MTENFGLAHMGNFINNLPGNLDANTRARLIQGLSRDTNNIYVILSEKQINASHAIQSICSLMSTFRTIMLEDKHTLSDVQQLRLYGAFRNMMNEVKIIVSTHNEALAASRESQGWLAWGKSIISLTAAKTYDYTMRYFEGRSYENESIEDLIYSIENALKTIEHDSASIDRIRSDIGKKLNAVKQQKQEHSSTENNETIDDDSIDEEGHRFYDAFDESDDDDTFFDAREEFDDDECEFYDAYEEPLPSADQVNEHIMLTETLQLERFAKEVTRYIENNLKNDPENIFSEGRWIFEESELSTESRAPSFSQKLAEGAHEIKERIIKAAREKISDSTRFITEKYISRAAVAYTPEKIFHTTQPFNEFVEHLILSTIEERINPSHLSSTLEKIPLAKSALRKIARHYTEALQKNLTVVANEEMLQRLGITTCRELSRILSRINDDEHPKTPDEILKSLGIEESFDKYKRSVKQHVTQRVGMLLTYRGEKSAMTATKKFIGEQIFLFTQRTLLSFNKNMTKMVTSIALKTIFPLLLKVIEREKPFGDTTNEANTPSRIIERASVYLLHRMGILKDINASHDQNDLIALYILDSISKEMADIIHDEGSYKSEETAPSKTRNTDLSSAISDVAKEISSLAQKGKIFHNTMTGLVLQKSSLFLTAIIEQQGRNERFFDISTPVIKIIVPAWRSWIAGEK